MEEYHKDSMILWVSYTIQKMEKFWVEVAEVGVSILFIFVDN